MVILDDATTTNTTSMGQNHIISSNEITKREVEFDCFELNKKLIKQDEINEMRLGWINPRTIALNKKSRSSNIKKTIRNNLPVKIREDE